MIVVIITVVLWNIYLFFLFSDRRLRTTVPKNRVVLLLIWETRSSTHQQNKKKLNNNNNTWNDLWTLALEEFTDWIIKRSWVSWCQLLQIVYATKIIINLSTRCLEWKSEIVVDTVCTRYFFSICIRIFNFPVIIHM